MSDVAATIDAQVENKPWMGSVAALPGSGIAIRPLAVTLWKRSYNTSDSSSSPSAAIRALQCSYAERG
jgi:hypothetical protein